VPGGAYRYSTCVLSACVIAFPFVCCVPSLAADQALVGALLSSDCPSRSEAICRLGELTQEEQKSIAVDLCEVLSGEGDRDRYYRAGDVLCIIGLPAVQPLVDALSLQPRFWLYGKSSTPSIDSCVVTVLPPMGISGRENTYWSNHASVLVKIGKPAVPFLVKAVEGEKYPQVLLCSIILSRIGSDAVPEVAAILVDRDENTTLRALRILEEMKSGAVTAWKNVANLLDDRRSKVRVAAVEALETISPKEEGILDAVIPRIMDLLDDGDIEVRKSASHSLGVMERGRQTDGVIRGLIRILSRDDESGEYAGWALERIGEPAIPALMGCLSEEGVRNDRARRALSRIGKKALPRLTDAFRSDNNVLADSAARTLALLREEALPAYIMALKSKNRKLQLRALEIIGGSYSPDKAFPCLIRLLGDSDRDIRLRAIEAVGRMEGWGKDAVGPLIRNLSDEDRAIRNAAVTALGWLGKDSAEARGPLLEAMRRCDADDRELALAFSRIGEGMIPQLVEELHNSASCVRRKAYLSLFEMFYSERIDMSQAVPPLVELLGDGDPSIRSYALGLLGPFGAKTASTVPLLVNMICTDPDPSIRSRAVTLLGQFGAKAASAVPLLVNMICTDPDLFVRVSAIRATTNIGVFTPECMRAIGMSLDAHEYIIRWAAVDCIRAMGLQGRAFVPQLRRCLSDLWDLPRKGPDGYRDKTGYIDLRDATFRTLIALAGKDNGAFQSVASALKSDDPFLWQNALDALGRMEGKSPESLSKMIELIGDDRNEDRKCKTIRVMAHIGKGEKDVFAAIARSMKSSKAKRRDCAGTILMNARDCAGAILMNAGLAAEKAIPVLVDYLRSDDSDLRERAKVILEVVRSHR